MMTEILKTDTHYALCAMKLVYPKSNNVHTYVLQNNRLKCNIISLLEWKRMMKENTAVWSNILVIQTLSPASVQVHLPQELVLQTGTALLLDIRTK